MSYAVFAYILTVSLVFKSLKTTLWVYTKKGSVPNKFPSPLLEMNNAQYGVY